MSPGSSPLGEEPRGHAYAMDDEWVTDESKMELARIRKKMRKEKYVPKTSTSPIPGRVEPRAKGSGSSESVPKVGSHSAPADDPDLQDYEPSEPEAQKNLPEQPRVPRESSLEPRRVSLPLPGQEVSRASLQYKRMLEKLNNDVELYKLHVKHYHMSSAQFRRRTSMLGLGEIYDKYDRIVKGCRICNTSAPTPPRARIAGLRASSFGDLIFVDHEEIKFGNSAYLALVVIDGASNLLWATALKSLEATETLGAFRLWTEENNCIPKGIVGDQAFFTEPYMEYYKFHGITPYPCGRGTPWPRAETAVSALGRLWLRLWQTKVMLKRSLFVKQSRGWLGQETANLLSQAILLWK